MESYLLASTEIFKAAVSFTELGYLRRQWISITPFETGQSESLASLMKNESCIMVLNGKKNPGSAPGKKDWTVALFLFLFSDPVYSYSSWQCLGHLGIEKGGEGVCVCVCVCSLRAFALILHICIDLSVSI
jgi:hypothetical protein